ncbi:MAG: GNAT family N-acetyltransferase [Dehalococcoidia bacterium]
MPSDLFTHCAAVVRRTEAADMGCHESDFDSNSLVVVPRPGKVLFPEYAMLISSFGTGTVISVEAGFIDWVHANRPAKHWAAYNASFLGPLADHIANTTDPPGRLIARSMALGFVLSDDPVVPALPAGFTLEQRGLDWMKEWRSAGQFHNSIGDPDEDDWFVRLVRAFVVVDESGEPVAMTAVADDGNGRMELGLDVRRQWRGLGLARPAVLAASRWVLDQGQVPYYTCGAANIRSHLVAESCGYRPLWSISGIARIVEGVGDQAAH